MKPDKVFKRYDVRGKYPEELDKEFVERMGESLGFFAKTNYNETVVVCRDTKESSELLKKKLIEGLRSQGIDVQDIGVGPTDMASFHCSKRGCIGVQVTSSHMPLEFNGLKFMYPKGNGFINEDLNELEEIFRRNSFEKENKGSLEQIGDAGREYREGLKQFIEDKIGVPEGRKIVVETMGGAGANYLPETLKELGFEVYNLKDSDNPYRDPPNPSPEHLNEVVERVKSEDADLGLALDLDADRIAAYYDGEWVSGDDLFCVFSQLFKGDVAASVDTDTKLEKFCSNIFYTRVGDPFVISETIAKNTVLSGEPNGHYCFPKFVNYNSGTLSGLILACCGIGDLLENIPKSYVKEDDISFSSREETEKAMKEFEKHARNSFNVISDIDGVKFVLEDYTVLVRPSGSSPKIRVKCSGGDEGVEDALKKVLAVLQKVKT